MTIAQQPRHRRLLAVLALGAVLGGCTGSTDGQAPTPAPTSAPEPTGTVTATETATEAVTTTTATTTASATATSDTAVAEGSGCAPGTDDLPDGRWFGQVTDVGEDTLEFNLMCWFGGNEALKAAEEDGRDPQEVTNDYYVRDDNPLLREIPWDAGADAVHYPSGDPSDPREVTLAEWADLFRSGSVYLGVWLTVEEGDVVELEEQWVP